LTRFAHAPPCICVADLSRFRNRCTRPGIALDSGPYCRLLDSIPRNIPGSWGGSG
jgi:hypothetical protein